MSLYKHSLTYWWPFNRRNPLTFPLSYKWGTSYEIPNYSPPWLPIGIYTAWSWTFTNLIIQTMNLEDHQEFETIKIPTQSSIIHTLYQLDTLPFLKALQKAPREHGRKTFCTSCYHLGHFKRDCPFYCCSYCHLIWPHHDKDQCLDNPKYSSPTPIKQESPSPPPLQIPPPKTVKKPHFFQNWQNSSSSSSSNRISKRGCKGKKPEWKKFQDSVDKSLVREFQEMDKKYVQELKNFSIDTDYQEQYDYEAYNSINEEPGHYDF